MGKPEDYVEKYLVKQCKKQDLGCLKFTSPGTNGVPDRIIIANGRTIFVETKRAGGKLRRLQEEITAEMSRQGADVRVADTRELIDELMTELAGTPSEATGAKTPDITHLIRANLTAALPAATPEQIDELMATAEGAGRTLNAKGSADSKLDQQPALDRIVAMADRWENTPALRRGAAARELRDALQG